MKGSKLMKQSEETRRSVKVDETVEETEKKWHTVSNFDHNDDRKAAEKLAKEARTRKKGGERAVHKDCCTQLQKILM